MTHLLHLLVAEAADRDPDHPAIRCRGEQISYGDLWRRAQDLAAHLIERGVEPGDRVGILCNKSIETAVAIYGIMAAGAAYVPLDPTAPPSRLAFVIEDCDIDIVISQPRHNRLLGQMETAGASLSGVIGGDDIPFPTISWSGVEGAGPPPPVQLMEQDLCYVLYTSGSTGVPKGIMHTHRSALSWANVTAAAYELRPEDRLSNYAPIHFDLSTLDFFGGARAGATTVMVPEEAMKLPASLVAFLADEAITVFYTVPMAIAQLAQPGLLDARPLDAIRLVLFGGEPVPPKHLATTMKALPKARFFNVYGPTEVNGCTHYEIPAPPEDGDPPVPIGYPYENVEAQLLRPDGSLCDVGETGELIIRAPTMMKGYWGRKDLNDRAFHFRNDLAGLPDVFHRTGDLAHSDRDGLLHFHGRRDRQIKTRGYRVELDEVEAVLLAHPDVIEAATYAITAADGTVEIQAAALVESAVEESDVRSFMSGSLPSYALPTRIHFFEEFPRTTTGKIDRRALAAVSQEAIPQ